MSLITLFIDALRPPPQPSLLDRLLPIAAAVATTVAAIAAAWSAGLSATALADTRASREPALTLEPLDKKIGVQVRDGRGIWMDTIREDGPHTDNARLIVSNFGPTPALNLHLRLTWQDPGVAIMAPASCSDCGEVARIDDDGRFSFGMAAGTMHVPMTTTGESNVGIVGSAKTVAVDWPHATQTVFFPLTFTDAAASEKRSARAIASVAGMSGADVDRQLLKLITGPIRERTLLATITYDTLTGRSLRQDVHFKVVTNLATDRTGKQRLPQSGGELQPRIEAQFEVSLEQTGAPTVIGRRRDARAQ